MLANGRAHRPIRKPMARAGLVRLTDSVFEKDGKQIPYRKAHLTRDAEHVDENTPLELTIRDTAPISGSKKRKTAAKKKRRPRAAPARDSRLEEMLRTRRTGLAKRQGVPAFRIMSDKVLIAIAETRPSSAAALLAIPGIGIASVEKYGRQIYRILDEARG